jgi:hypothetical protein
MREALLAAAFFLVVTVLMTWPQALRLGTAMRDLWDAKLSAWILHWDFVQTLRDPLALFQAPVLYPARYALAFSENMYGAAVFGFPLLAAGAPLVVNYNVNLLLAMFLSALAAWALARDWTGDPAASLAAGVIYAFLPYKIAQLPHLHMQWGAFLPLVFLFLVRTPAADGATRRGSAPSSPGTSRRAFSTRSSREPDRGRSDPGSRLGARGGAEHGLRWSRFRAAREPAIRDPVLGLRAGRTGASARCSSPRSPGTRPALNRLYGDHGALEERRATRFGRRRSRCRLRGRGCRENRRPRASSPVPRARFLGAIEARALDGVAGFSRPSRSGLGIAAPGSGRSRSATPAG